MKTAVSELADITEGQHRSQRLINRAVCFFRKVSNLNYITLHKIVFRVPKITRTTRRTLHEIKGVMWKYSYVRKHLEKNKFLNSYRKQAEFVRI